jgi:hypothetical protein
MQEGYFDDTQARKVTSKLHKLANYKSNYTRTIYERVKTSLSKGECKPT